MARERTTKGVAKRIALDYFARPHPLRTWKVALSTGGASIAMIAVAGLLLIGDDRAYSSGPLSPPHRLFERRCSSCHAGSGEAGFFRSVTDRACSRCHEGTPHRANQVGAPACADCHAEHESPPVLVSDRNTQCTACHAALVTRDGPPRVAGNVTHFTRSGHPEFAVLRAGANDPGTVRLNHRLHLKEGLLGPSGPVQLTCESCHHPDAARAHMLPTSFERDCKTCHALTFDLYGLFPEETAAPHGAQPAGIDAWLRVAFEGVLERDPAIWRRAPSLTSEIDRPMPEVLWRAEREVPPRSAEEWVSRRAEEAERLLLRRSCQLCHDLSYGEHPEVLEAAIPAHWLPAAEFGHEAHRFLKCAACHPAASRSQETSDILVPGISPCLGCHRGVASGAATDRCVSCHPYHRPSDGSLEGPLEADMTEWKGSR